MTSTTELPYIVRKRLPSDTYPVDTKATATEPSHRIGHVARIERLLWVAYPADEPYSSATDHGSRADAAAWLYRRWLQR